MGEELAKRERKREKRGRVRARREGRGETRPKAGEVHSLHHRREGFTKLALRVNVEQDGGENGGRGNDGREHDSSERRRRESQHAP